MEFIVENRKEDLKKIPEMSSKQLSNNDSDFQQLLAQNQVKNSKLQKELYDLIKKPNRIPPGSMN